MKKVLVIKDRKDRYKFCVSALKEEGIPHDILSYDSIDAKAALKYQKSFVIMFPPCETIEERFLYTNIISLLRSLEIKVFPNHKHLEVFENKHLFDLYFENPKFKLKSMLVTSTDSLLKAFNNYNRKIVLKSITGSGSSLVKIITNKYKLAFYNFLLFQIPSQFRLGLIPWGKKLGFKIPFFGHSARHAYMVEEFKLFEYEWRFVIQYPYFYAFKKEKDIRGYASGSKSFSFGLPPTELIEFFKIFISEYKIESGAIDIFECGKNYFVNEFQVNYGCIEKSAKYPNSQMFDYDGNPCIYIFDNHNYDGHNIDSYTLVNGEYCQNKTWNLKVKYLKNFL